MDLARKEWTKEETDHLQDKWGVVSIKGIAKQLGRNVSSIKQKASRLGLGDPRMNFEGITVCQLAKALGREYSVIKVWFTRYNMPAKKKIFCQESRVLVIGYDDFWKWAEKHKELLNLAKMEENTIGPEPLWVKVKRGADKMRSQRTWQSTAWEPSEDQRLLQLVKLADMTYPELAKRLNRSEVSIRRRLYDLYAEFKPKRSRNDKYTDEQIQKLKQMATAGYAYETIGQALRKSAIGVRGKLERMNFDFKRRQFRDVN